MIAQYLRISTTGVPDMRPEGIPDAVCSAIERAMALDPADRPASAEEFGRELQAAQRINGLKAEAMAITGGAPVSPDTNGGGLRPAAHDGPTSAIGAPVAPGASIETAALSPSGPDPGAPSQAAGLSRSAHAMETQPEVPAGGANGPPSDPGGRTPPSAVPPPWRKPVALRIKEWFTQPGERRNRAALVGGAVAVVAVLVAGAVFLWLRPHNGNHGTSAGAPSTPAPAAWKPITNARIARDAVATTQADGTIWVFGGIRSDGVATTRHEGYDPAIDEWKGGDDLPVALQHAAAVTWQGNPVVLGGWRTDNGKNVASEQVWRVVNSRWVELPHLLQPRAAAAAAVVGDRLVVTGGVDANGALLNTTEVFDGNSWSLGAPIPTPRQLLAAASDGKLVYAVGGRSGGSDLATVEAYDPAAKTWTALAALP